MDIIIRPAKPSDKEDIVKFTQNTWSWGDYIERVFDKWLTEEDSLLLVAEYRRRAIAILRAKILPDKSVWLEGLRVHPEYRRLGVATKINHKAIKMMSSRGYRVFRGAIFEWNSAALKLVDKLGFRILEHKWIVYRGKPKFRGTEEPAVLSPQEFLRSIKRTKRYVLSRLIADSYKWFLLNEESLDKLEEKETKLLTYKNLYILARKHYFDNNAIIDLNIFYDAPQHLSVLKDIMGIWGDSILRLNIIEPLSNQEIIEELLSNMKSSTLFIFERKST